MEKFNEQTYAEKCRTKIFLNSYNSIMKASYSVEKDLRALYYLISGAVKDFDCRKDRDVKNLMGLAECIDNLAFNTDLIDEMSIEDLDYFNRIGEIITCLYLDARFCEPEADKSLKERIRIVSTILKRNAENRLRYRQFVDEDHDYLKLDEDITKRIKSGEGKIFKDYESLYTIISFVCNYYDKIFSKEESSVEPGSSTKVIYINKGKIETLRPKTSCVTSSSDSTERKLPVYSITEDFDIKSLVEYYNNFAGILPNDKMRFNLDEDGNVVGITKGLSQEESKLNLKKRDE